MFSGTLPDAESNINELVWSWIPPAECSGVCGVDGVRAGVGHTWAEVCPRAGASQRGPKGLRSC